MKKIVETERREWTWRRKRKFPPPSGGDCGVRGPGRVQAGRSARGPIRARRGEIQAAVGGDGQRGALSTPSTGAAVSTAFLEQQPRLFETEVAVVSEDQMVNELHLEQTARQNELPRGLTVRLARTRIS